MGVGASLLKKNEHGCIINKGKQCCVLIMSCPSSSVPMNSWYAVDQDAGLTFRDLGGGLLSRLSFFFWLEKPAILIVVESKLGN